MGMNLVVGGARRGWFQTRHSRLVHITKSFNFSESAHPGMTPQSRTCWEGELYQADGKTIDTIGVWEESGAAQNTLGVIQRNDLVILVRIDPEEVPPNKALPLASA